MPRSYENDLTRVPEDLRDVVSAIIRFALSEFAGAVVTKKDIYQQWHVEPNYFRFRIPRLNAGQCGVYFCVRGRPSEFTWRPELVLDRHDLSYVGFRVSRVDQLPAACSYFETSAEIYREGPRRFRKARATAA